MGPISLEVFRFRPPLGNGLRASRLHPEKIAQSIYPTPYWTFISVVTIHPWWRSNPKFVDGEPCSSENQSNWDLVLSPKRCHGQQTVFGHITIHRVNQCWREEASRAPEVKTKPNRQRSSDDLKTLWYKKQQKKARPAMAKLSFAAKPIEADGWVWYGRHWSIRSRY